MANQVGAFDVVHHGWASVSYNGQESKKFEITSEQKLHELAKNIGLQPDCVSNILNAVDLSQRKLVLVYCVSTGGGVSHGVKKIERVASAIHVHICSFDFPGGCGTAPMEGDIIVLSARKDIKEEILTEIIKLKVDQEPEYAGLGSHEAANAKLVADRGNYERDIDSRLRWGDLTEEKVRGEKWFTDLNPAKQALAIRKLHAYRDYAQFELATVAAYRNASARLCGRAFHLS
jgi:hypothetical protein